MAADGKFEFTTLHRDVPGASSKETLELLEKWCVRCVS